MSTLVLFRSIYGGQNARSGVDDSSVQCNRQPRIPQTEPEHAIPILTNHVRQLSRGYVIPISCDPTTDRSPVETARSQLRGIYDASDTVRESDSTRFFYFFLWLRSFLPRM